MFLATGKRCIGWGWTGSRPRGLEVVAAGSLGGGTRPARGSWWRGRSSSRATSACGAPPDPAWRAGHRTAVVSGRTPHGVARPRGRAARHDGPDGEGAPGQAGKCWLRDPCAAVSQAAADAPDRGRRPGGDRQPPADPADRCPLLRARCGRRVAVARGAAWGLRAPARGHRRAPASLARRRARSRHRTAGRQAGRRRAARRRTAALPRRAAEDCRRPAHRARARALLEGTGPPREDPGGVRLRPADRRRRLPGADRGRGSLRPGCCPPAGPRPARPHTARSLHRHESSSRRGPRRRAGCPSRRGRTGPETAR